MNSNGVLKAQVSNLRQQVICNLMDVIKAYYMCLYLQKIHLILLILWLFTSCSPHKSLNTNMTDCLKVSKMIEQLGIIDEPKCNKKITIVVDTIGNGGSFTYDLGKIESVYKWDFKDCSNFSIQGNSKIEVVPVVYKLLHSETQDLRMNPPDNETCFNIVVSNITKYKHYHFFTISIENHSVDFTYLGAFLFDMDKYSNLKNIKIWTYRNNHMSENDIDLYKKYPKYVQKSRF